ncbi:MAG: GGDEF domain-containing protein [bacterium]
MESEYKKIIENYRPEFIAAALAVVVVVQIAYYFFNPEIHSLLNEHRMWYNIIIVFLSAVIFLVAWISYPKIYKFKMLLTGAALISFFVIFLIIMNRTVFGIETGRLYELAWRPADKFTLKFLLTLLNINLLIIVLVEPSVNYKLGKNLSWIFLAANTVFFIFVLYTVAGNYHGGFSERFATRFVSGFNGYFVTINLLIFVLTAVFSFYSIENEHNYGSILVGVGIILFYCVMNAEKIYPVRMILPAMAVLVLVGMFSHWVSCLHHKAHYDPLTRIYNRQYMDSIFEGIADVKLGKEIGVLMCDIDHFKKVNDTYGHAAGDIILHGTAQIIRDTALPEGIVCRYGGEEITVILRDKVEDEARFKAEKIRKAVKKNTFKFKNKNVRVTLSIGVADTAEGVKGINKAIKKADENVYKAKKRGRDRVVM